MKKHLALLLVLYTFTSINAKREVFSHSFMYTKPGYYDVVMEQALWHNIAYNKKGSIDGGIQVTPFFQDSIPLHKNARYFLMKDQTALLVAGDNTEFKVTRDIRAEWVGLPSNFSGILSLNPKQKQQGFTFEYHQNFKQWLDVVFLRDIYITAIIPFAVVKNNIQLRQCDVVNPGETFPQDILQAFNNPDWCYSRIVNGQKKQGIAEIKLKIGTSYISEDYFQINYYSVLTIPTGNKQNGETMFEPVNGNNHHLGIGAGINLQAPLNRDTTSFAWCVFLDLESSILIRNKQFRTYDLFNNGFSCNPWSRFVMMNTPSQTNQPGVNFMTQRITAKPFNVVDFALGWRLNNEFIEAELGYGIWGHGNERTDINQPFPYVPFGIAGSGPGKTASKSTIAQQAEDDAVFTPILRSDFNPQSGESFGGFTQRAFGSLGWVNKGITIDSILGAGWSVDVPFHNSFLQLWKVWVKLGATF
jgi:hypothetical protein